jgi:hypothetical protein
MKQAAPFDMYFIDPQRVCTTAFGHGQFPGSLRRRTQKRKKASKRPLLRLYATARTCVGRQANASSIDSGPALPSARTSSSP